MELNEEQRDWLKLALIPGVGTALFIRLIARFRTPADVLRASRGQLREVVGPKLATRIAEYSDVAPIEAQEKLMREYHAEFRSLDDPGFPERLAEIYDPPLGLFIRGTLFERDSRCVAMVGTRRASPYGIRIAERLARELAVRGVTIVSGMATGIDAAAHRGALDAKGRTIAVLGCGVDQVYPRQNAELMSAIIENGCVLSQFPMGTKPSKGHFPLRNRVISGLTLGVIVVQAPEDSGALITAHSALEQGREVFAVPGEIGNPNSAGPHKLLRYGAKLVESADDVMEELALADDAWNHDVDDIRLDPTAAPEPDASEPAPPPVAPAPASASSALEKDILVSLRQDGSFVDEIAETCRISIAEALSTLTMLELKGVVRQFSGKRFAPR